MSRSLPRTPKVRRAASGRDAQTSMVVFMIRRLKARWASLEVYGVMKWNLNALLPPLFLLALELLRLWKLNRPRW